MERRPARPQRNGVLRLLSLELNFSDERCAEALSDERYLAAMARFEGALAAACAKAGLMPAAHGEAIRRSCEGARFDAAALARAARDAGTLAIPFLDALRAQIPGDAASSLHFGATSQDVVDTATSLCLKAASERLVDLTGALGNAAAGLAERHASTPTTARTLLQPALPVPFGWKAAVWLSFITRSHVSFGRAARDACALQLGGPAGTLSGFGAKGPAVAAALAAELGLPPPGVTWHSARDGFARLGAEAAILAGAAAKIARDVSLLMQAEVAEAAEPARPGRGGSSSMPHKRNPALCMLALEAGQRAPGLAATLLAGLSPEHERGLGQWQGQWLTLRALFMAASSAVGAMAEVLSGLEVNTAAMQANLERLVTKKPSNDTAARAMIEQALVMWREKAP
jgi:3-carboxy-cis,cis-muconate cycloisomerase